MNRNIKKANKVHLLNKGTITCQNDKSAPLFSFAYLTTNNNYTFKHFNDSSEELACRKEFDKLLLLLSTTSWLDLIGRNKRQLGGYETIPIEQIAFSPANFHLSKDTKLLSFRFGSKDKYRMLGWRKDGCQALYIIGYDFDFSAYKHGS
ncbi:MAG: hypothetical protein LBR56_04430 [Sporomusaceae bacterium]|jgi:hypothetical protein|nr:hypothetical protein [Sporomusaceae bacterium]